MSEQDKQINIQYFAVLKEERGLSSETVQTSSKTVRELFNELSKKHRFSLNTERLNVAVNDEFQPWETTLKQGDTVVFIPPVAGG
ncbi:MAG TPA: molybdopterin converting factor subunit 1 [Oculatellaceae cyanobacterium]